MLHMDVSLCHTYVHDLLVFHRKDLCEARVNFKVSSYFQMRCTLRQADPPGTDILWPRAELDNLQMTWPQAELGHLFR